MSLQVATPTPDLVPARHVVCYSVVADATPSALPRIFDALAVHGLVPERCHGAFEPAARNRPRRLTLDVHVTLEDLDLAGRIAQRLGRIVEVEDVLMGSKCIA